MRIRRLPYLCAVLLLAPGLATAAKLFEAHSKAPGAKMDISLREIERRPRSSVLAIEVRDPGSSVGGSFFILCSIRKLALGRGGYAFIAKKEEHPRRGQMLVGFLRSEGESPAAADPALAAEKVVGLEQFAPICDQMR